MMARMVCIVLCVVCLAPLGCASKKRQFTGFLRDYAVLEPHPTIQSALVYWNPDIDLKKYTAVLVEPVEVHIMNRDEQNRVKPGDVAAFCRVVTDELTTAISKYAAIATEPGPNVLRCRLQVANLQFTRPIGEPRHPWLPPDYASGSANIETYAQDSISGEVVVAYVSPPGSVAIYTPSLLAAPPDRWEPARTVIRHSIETWTDHAARFFVSGESGAGVSCLTSWPTTPGSSSVTAPTASRCIYSARSAAGELLLRMHEPDAAFMNKSVNIFQEREPCPGK